MFGTQLFGIKLGLENIQRLLGALNLPAHERIIHVAGTNGKGSVCAMIDAICRAQGYRTGLFTSPHLVTFRERIRVNGEMISEAEVATGLTTIKGLVRDWEPHPTFFEIATALGLLHFREEACEIIVLETGLGGRLDATNAVLPVVSVITPIDYDHQKWLGNTLEEIAAEKAGIIKPHVPVVAAAQPSVAERVLREARAAWDFDPICQRPLSGLRSRFPETPTAQRRARCPALNGGGICGDVAGVSPTPSTVVWQARFQRWDQRIVLDGAHNPAGAKILAQTWREQFGDKRATLILAVLIDKDVTGICQALAPISDSVILPRIRSERALPPEDLARTLSSIAPSLPHSIAPSVADALERARQGSSPILLTGSLHFAGEALAALRGDPAAFEECAQ